MTLPSGTRLGPYEVVAPLGAGGMGEVYRASDARLAREVAIKVLPATFARDPDRLRRLEQEARAAGSLNHPNILAVHDTGHHEGSPYVVCELLSGQTLRERLAGAPLPLRKAVEIATQIARGLAAAHEKGIVHRDLKPDNVFVTDDGHVKILDFGLAKVLQPDTGDESHSPTQTRATDPGVVLGTAAYMSPEQVRGAALDHRSDIFSFGTILYEMLTGRRAFKKETAAETMAAILREDPPDLTEANEALPPALERIVAHCLEKNAQERFASARDLAFDLESLSDRSATTARAVRPGKRSRRGAILAAGWLASLALVGGGAFVLGRRTDPPRTRYQRLTYGHGKITGAAFSPDGASVVYSATWNGAPSKIFSMRLDMQSEQPLGLEGTVIAAAAGELAYLREDGTLLRTPLTGGGAREVAKGVRSADWSRDGTRIAVARRVGAKGVLEYPVGTVVGENVGDFLRVRISPDGGRVAVVDRTSAGVAGGFITVMDAGGARRLTNDVQLIPTSLAWSPDGNEVWFTADEQGDYALYAVSLSGHRRLLMRAAEEPRFLGGFGDGRVLMSLGQTRRQAAGLFPGERVERDLSLRGFTQSWDMSADGSRYVVADDTGSNTVSAFLGETDGSPLVRIGEGIPNSLSPDGGSMVVWKDSTEGVGAALTLLPTGAGQAREIPRGTIRSYLDARFLPDGRLLLSASEAGRPRRLFVQELPEGLPKPITPEGVFTEYAFTTPDGSFVPAGSNYDEAPYVLYPVGGGEARPIPGLEKGDQPIRFSADGRRLFVRSGFAADNTKARISMLDLATGRKQPWKVIGPADPAGVDEVSLFYPSADGRAYVYTYDRLLSNLYLVDHLN